MYKLFGTSGLRVSEICLGTMTFGTEWGYGADKEESRKMFQLYLEKGGNFIDTANRYTEGTSERFIGDFVKESGRRDELVIATKYSLYTQSGRINDSGNHRKNLIQSVQGSLERLQMEYVDLLYVHAWDFTVHPQEVLRALDDLVRSGQVLHIAISDTPAWIISQSNAVAELRGWSSYCGVQLEYSLITRDAERDLLPMAKAFNLGITAWAPLAGGALTGKYLHQNNHPKRLKEGSRRLNDKSTSIAREVGKIAAEKECTSSQVALRWLMQRSNVFPVVGARHSGQLHDNLGVQDIHLSDEQLKRLDEVSDIDLGFPHDFLQQDGVKQVLFGGLRDRVKF